ncbi:glucanase-5 [Coleophoma crateriformis]|uniref:Glucanase n=1 Tax=Coleophoma crateriformis TaxID=565419 RepID=A0A3D8RCG5_9HELO|nr:glucanase-5 [Coleophoma crateriformis]
MHRTLALLCAFAAKAYAQQAGTLTTETHPALPMQSCSAAGTCTTLNTKIVIDANWRWLHSVSGSTNCYTGNTWDATLCPDDVTCAKNCALDGADYSGVYGITTSGSSLRMNFVTKGANTNVGSRVYLMDTTDSTYKLFKVKGQEFTFDVDVSNMPCGLNGAVYFAEMDADGGTAKYSGNKAGAKYGTGYCDAQCPHDIKFINGEANVDGWVPSTNDVNAGSGTYGSCCNEMDIWEANSISAAYTPHVCTVAGQTRCSGTSCGDDATGNRYNGVCDKDGCDFNSYRMGNTSFFGPSKIVDTTKPFTVVTQFITADGTTSGTLSQIKRFYVQNGVVIPNSVSNVAGVTATNAISDTFCNQQKTAFGDTNTFEANGGLAAMGTALDTGMVLVLSIWDDHAVNMLWLDSTYPTTSTGPGSARGTCPTTSGSPTDVEANSPNSYVVYSNIKIGPLGSTFASGSAPVGSSSSSTLATSTTSKPVSTSTSSASPTTSTVPKYGQCGGISYTGPTTCVAGTTCVKSSDYYSQCL